MEQNPWDTRAARPSGITKPGLRGRLSAVLQEIPLKKVLVLDTETTGFGPADEILQLSAMWGTGTIAGNQLLRPSHVDSWEGAMAVNHITPAMVAGKPHLSEIRGRVEAVLSAADVLVGYNLPYDLRMLAQNGVALPPADKVFRVDLMPVFAEIYGEWNSRSQDYKWQKLITCARYYGYQGGGWHDSLADVRATLFCYKAMLERGEL